MCFAVQPQPFSFLSGEGTAGAWQPPAAQIECHCTYTTAETEAVVKEAMLSMRAHFDGNDGDGNGPRCDP